MVKCLPEFEYFYCILEKRNFISKIRGSKFTDYVAFKPTYNMVLKLYCYSYLYLIWPLFNLIQTFNPAVDKVYPLPGKIFEFHHKQTISSPSYFILSEFRKYRFLRLLA